MSEIRLEVFGWFPNKELVSLIISQVCGVSWRTHMRHSRTGKGNSHTTGVSSDGENAGTGPRSSLDSTNTDGETPAAVG
eukprot:4860897-Prymnesium_polylepis.4